MDFPRVPDPTWLKRKAREWLQWELDHNNLKPKPDHVEPLKFEDWISKFPAAKKKMYQHAKDLNIKYGVPNVAGRTEAFLKMESTTKFNDPRNISPRHPRFTVEIGPYWAMIEQLFGKARFLVKGKTPDVRDKYMSRLLNYDHFCEIDYSRFDRSLSFEILDAVEGVLAEYYFPESEFPYFHELWRTQLHTKGTTRDGYKYKLRGHRNSGDVQTSIGNGGINRFAKWLVFNKLPVSDWDGFSEGDDDLTAFYQKWLPIVTHNFEYIKNLGLEIKLNLSPIIDGLIFCGRILHEENGMVHSTADVERQLAKFHVNFSTLPAKQYLLAKSMSTLVDDPHTPVLSELCHAYLRTIDEPPNMKKIMRSALDKWAKMKLKRINDKFPKPNPTPHARAALALKGIPVEHQLELEAHYRSWPFVPSNPLKLFTEPKPIPNDTFFQPEETLAVRGGKKSTVFAGTHK